MLTVLILGGAISRAQSEYRTAGYRYLSPLPLAPYCSQQTRFVLVRFENVPPVAVTNLAGFITVTGAVSGDHPGVTHIATDERTVIFEMSADFAANELVTVTLQPQVNPVVASGTLEAFTYQFMVTAPFPDQLPEVAGAPSAPEPPEVIPEAAYLPPAQQAGPTPGGAGSGSFAAAVISPNGVSLPKDFPTVTISVNDNPSPGYIFLETGVSNPSKYTMMLDNNGLPIWYQRGRLGDFKIQKNGTITWCVGDGLGFESYDQNFNHLNTFLTVNGFSTEGHDFEVRPSGDYLMLGYRTNLVNLSAYITGAPTRAIVREDCIQEFTAAGELIFQWRAWDYFDIRDEGGNTDFSHMNALDYDDDGNILVSSRHLSEVTKINRDTGDIMWRLSGAHNQFTFVNDEFNGTSYQHDISGLGNGHYMVFDNGVTHKPQVSRAVEYVLDLTNMTATVAWEFRDTPDKYAYWLGNAQRLPSGNTLINFVRPAYPKAIEVDTNGVKHFQLSISPNSDSYRTFRFPWTGAAAAPYLIVEPQADNVTLLFNKFGDTNVASYRIYGGISPAPTQLLATATTTLAHLTNAVNGVTNYFRVTAVSRQGVESKFSNEENLVVNLTLPGQNMVLNGDFSQGTSPWIWQVTLPAQAQWLTTGGLSHFLIGNGGIYITDLRLRQAGMKLTQGKEYTFEFDAWSAAPRTIEAKVEQNLLNGINYSGLQPLGITPATNHFSFHFTMTQPTDNSARVVFNVGALPQDVYLANVSLRERVYAPGDFNWDGCVGWSDLKVLTGQWQKALGQSADLNGDGKVDFGDFVRFANSWNGGSCP